MQLLLFVFFVQCFFSVFFGPRDYFFWRLLQKTRAEQILTSNEVVRNVVLLWLEAQVACFYRAYTRIFLSSCVACFDLSKFQHRFSTSQQTQDSMNFLQVQSLYHNIYPFSGGQMIVALSTLISLIIFTADTKDLLIVHWY